MSIANYTDLKGAVSRWLHRADLVAVTPDLITLAETRFNRNLRVRQMQTAYSAETAIPIVALPADWLELVGAPVLGDKPLDYVTRDEYRTYTNADRNGNYYYNIGSELALRAALTEPATLAFDYYAKIPALSDAAPTNWLLTDAPDVYLYGTLLEAEPYMKNDTRIETWRGLLQVALTDLQASSDRAKHSGATLVMGGPR